jgi:hypothetical protein
MRREWTIWLAFTALVLVAVVFVVTRDDDSDSSKLSAGTSVPTTVAIPSTVTTRPLPPTTPTTPTSSTSVVRATAPPTTARQTTPGTSATTVPATVVVTQPPETAPPTTAPPVTEPPLKPAFGEGFYRINVDLPPGTYRSEGGPYCTWDRFSSAAYPPSATNLIASGYSTGAPISVAIAPTDGAFRTSGCAIWLGQ